MTTCPSCGKPPTKEETPWGHKFSCRDCDLWAWNCTALVSRATHSARKGAHAVFDRIWREGRMSRSQAYKELSEHLSLPREKTHIKLFNESMAIKTMDFARSVLGENHDHQQQHR